MSTRAAPSLELVLPGVLQSSAHAADAASPSLPALETLLARARARPAPMRAPRLLCLRFGLPLEHDEDEPLAALACSAADDAPATDWCMYLSPVHLQVDRDRMLAFAPDASLLGSADETALFEVVARHLRAEALTLVRLAPGEWVVRSPRPWALATRGPFTHGVDAATGLPRGADASYWIALINELQMVLHAHPANQRREATGELASNSVWPWGAGQLPAAVSAQGCHVSTDFAYARGLALLAGTPATPMPRDFAEWLASAQRGEHLLAGARACLPAGAAPVDWQRALEHLEADWFAPALRALRRQQLRRLSLWLGGRRQWQLGSAAARWRWRWRRPLSHY